MKLFDLCPDDGRLSGWWCKPNVAPRVASIRKAATDIEPTPLTNSARGPKVEDHICKHLRTPGSSYSEKSSPSCAKWKAPCCQNVSIILLRCNHRHDIDEKYVKFWKKQAFRKVIWVCFSVYLHSLVCVFILCNFFSIW